MAQEGRSLPKGHQHQILSAMSDFSVELWQRIIAFVLLSSTERYERGFERALFARRSITEKCARCGKE